jgi:hypothetical protein
VSLTLAESSAVALLAAAEALDGTDGADTFLAAIESNHRLWLALTRFAGRHGWTVIDPRMTDFVVSMSYKAGRGIPDEHIEALIGINRDVSSWLAAGGDVAAIRQRAEAAWTDADRPTGMSLLTWLMSEIERHGHDAA